MAFLAAAPAILGGMTIGTAVTLGATVAAGALSARQSYVAGKHQEIQSKLAADKEASASRQEEIDRRRELIKSLADRNALAGVQGVVASEGSLAGLTRRDIRDNRDDLLALSGNSAARQRAFRLQGKSAKQAGYAEGAVSLLDTVARVGGLK